MRVLVPVKNKFSAKSQMNFVSFYKWPQFIDLVLLTVLQSDTENLTSSKALLNSLAKEIKTLYPGPGVAVRSLTEEGDPADKILNVANSWSAQVILLASDRLNNPTNGNQSVSNKVFTQSSCQTIIVSLPLAQSISNLTERSA